MHKHTPKLLIATALATGLTISSQVQAADKNAFRPNSQSNSHSFNDYGRVTHVQPVYQTVAIEKPRQECWIEESRHTTVYQAQNQRYDNNRRHNTGQTVLGGLIGGVIGNQLGSRSGSRQGRIGATVAGAIIGSAIANESPQRHRREQPARTPTRQVIETTPVERCTTRVETHHERRVQSYKVTYSYHGQQYTTHTKQHPGNRIPVQVSVRPIRR